MKRYLVTLLVTIAFATPAAHSQSPASLEGKWEGTFSTTSPEQQRRVVLNISRASDGLYIGRFSSVDLGPMPIPMDNIQLKDDSVRFEIKLVNGVFEGTLSEPARMKGTWNQGGPTWTVDITRSAATAEAPKAPDAVALTSEVLRSPFGIPMKMDVPVKPTPFPADGKTHLVYELHLTNYAPVEILVSKLEVLNGDMVLAMLEKDDLNHIMQQPAVPNTVDNRAVPPGVSAIAYLWVTLNPGAPVPAALRHRITTRNVTLTGSSVEVSKAKPIVIGPPLRGANWMAANGPGNVSAHRRALLPLNGSAAIAQRFAIDWLQVGANDRTFDGDAKENKTHFAYGNEVLAVADGVVTETRNGIPENVPGLTSRAVPITPETIGGNHVVLRLDDSHYAFYAHMQPGSLKVKPGDKVRRGQVLGLLGNTGNSSEPHLHFHISDGKAALESEGLPYLLDSFEVQTEPGVWSTKHNELPLQNARVRF